VAPSEPSLSIVESRKVSNPIVIKDATLGKCQQLYDSTMLIDETLVREPSSHTIFNPVLQEERIPSYVHRGPVNTESVITIVESSISMPNKAGAPERSPIGAPVVAVRIQVPGDVLPVLNEAPDTQPNAAAKIAGPNVALPFLSTKAIPLKERPSMPSVDEMDVLVKQAQYHYNS
jgi:hypothetical protein